MPAVAVPAIISVAGMAASAIGKHKAKKAAEKAAAKKKAELQNVMDFNYNADLDFQNSNTFQDILRGAEGPAVTTESGTQWQDTTSDATRSMDFGPEGNAAAADVLQAARNAPFEVNNLLAEQQAAANRALSGQERALNTGISNLAAARGVDPRLMKLGANAGINNERLNTALQSKQQAYGNRVGAYGNIANVLKGLFQKDITHEESSMKGGHSGRSSSTNPLGLAQLQLGAKRPVHKEFADVQGA
jgi:uncharacterized membrane protein